MAKLKTTKEQVPLLTSLDNYANICAMRLSGILTILDESIKRELEAKGSNLSFLDQYLFTEFNEAIDEVAKISWTAMQYSLLQNEIRKTLLSFQRERQDELYYVLIKDVLQNLNICIVGVKKYLTNRETYDDFIRAYKWEKGEDDLKAILKTFSKLHSQSSSRNLLNSANYLRIAIKSLIPTSDHLKVLPVEELQATSDSLDEEEGKGKSQNVLTTFQKLFLIRLLQKGRHFPKKDIAAPLKDELEFIGAITGLTYTGHLKKANAEVDKLMDNKLTPAQWRVRLKDIRAVQSVIKGMELPDTSFLIDSYEQTANQKLDLG